MILDLHRQGLSVSAIARQCDVDRKTVRKYIERGLEAPAYGPRKPRARVLDDFTVYLRERVKTFPGLTGSRLLRELKELGYQGGYTAVTDFLRDACPTPRPGFEVRFETGAGEQGQVDFVHFQVVFTDEPSTSRVVWLFSMVLGYSRLIWGRFVIHQDLATVLRCHVAAFDALGGAPREILYDRMKTAVTGSVRRLEQGEIGGLEAIDALLSEELMLRENSRIKTALRMGRLATIKTLAGFDVSFQPSLDRDRVLTLAQLGFVDRAEVVHLLGPPGTGKSHLAIALAVEAVKAGKSVYFCTLAELITTLARAEREGHLQEKLRFFCRPALLVVDEIGYLPVVPGGGNLFFQLVNARYERGAMILTSNRGFAEWGEVFGDHVVATALLDRLLHHAVALQIEGSSYRLRQHAELMPEHLRSKASIATPAFAPPGLEAVCLNLATPPQRTDRRNWGILLRRFWGLLPRH